MPNKRGVLIDREVGKIPKFNKQGVKLKGILEFEKRLIQGRKEQKHVVIEHKTNIYMQQYAILP